MDIVNLISNYYSTCIGKKPVVFAKPNLTGFVKPSLNKPVYPVYPIKFAQPNIYELSGFIKNEAIKRKNIQHKTLLEMLNNEKNQLDNRINKKINSISMENIIGAGIVGLGLWALYTYSGYSISILPTKLKIHG